MTFSPFDLNFRHLRGLVAVKEHGSVSAAAGAVSLSQPALTQGLAKLERQFGVALFERRANGMTTTPAGDLVADRVRAALGHLATNAKGISRGSDHLERRMTMTQLRAFLALADEGSCVSAARASDLSKTAVHRAIGELEHVIGRKLVKRHGRGLWLNAIGKRLARNSRLAIAEIGALAADLGLDRGESLVSIGALPLSRAFLVPGAMAAMVAEQTKARFEIIEGDRHELIEPLRDGIIDIVLGALPAHTDEEDLVQIPLYTERLVIVAGSQHPLVGKPTPSISALMNYPWIVAPPSSPLRSHWEQLFGARELPPRPIECGSVMIIGRLLTSGNFLTLLSQDQVALQIRSGLLARVGKPLANQACTIGMTTRRGWKPTAVQRRFIELLDAVAATKRTSETGGSTRLNLDLCWN